MKTLKMMSMLFIASALSFGFVGCGDDDENESSNTPTEKQDETAKTDYSKLLPGFWENAESGQCDGECFGFNNKGAGTLTFTDLVGCDWGVVAADGTYTLKDDVLTASYTDVTVWDSNYEKSTYHGSTSGKSKTVKYTIVSCDSKKLVMKNENGKSQTYTKYAELKK